MADAEIEIQKLKETMSLANQFDMPYEELIPVLEILYSVIRTIIDTSPFNARAKILALVMTVIRLHKDCYDPKAPLSRLENLLALVNSTDNLVQILDNK